MKQHSPLMSDHWHAKVTTQHQLMFSWATALVASRHTAHTTTHHQRGSMDAADPQPHSSFSPPWRGTKHRGTKSSS